MASPLLEVWCGTDHSGWVLLTHRSSFLVCPESRYLPSLQSHLYLTSPSEKRWHALMPGVACRWAKKRRKVAHSGNLHWCSSYSKFVSSDLGTRVSSVSINSQPIPFPAPLTGSCFKASLDRSCSSLILQRSLSARPASFSGGRNCHRGSYGLIIPGHPRKHPSGIVTHRQI